MSLPSLDPFQPSSPVRQSSRDAFRRYGSDGDGATKVWKDWIRRRKWRLAGSLEPL